MKALIASFALLFCSSAHAQHSVSDFAIRADKSFSFKLNAEIVTGTFAAGESASLVSGASDVHVYRHGKMIVVGAVKKTSPGQIFIFEEMNALFVPLTMSPINGATVNFKSELERMISISAIANNGDTEAGLRKINDSFRANPKQNVQQYIAKLGTRNTTAIAVGERNKIQTVRSFDELEGGSAPTTKRPAPRPRIVRKPKPRVIVPQYQHYGGGSYPAPVQYPRYYRWTY